MAPVAEGRRAHSASTTVIPGRVLYCVSDDRHFLGAVALVNSLRLSGWADKIVVVDCGLEDEHRSVLEREAEVIPAPESTAPHLLKVAGPLARPAEFMVLVDADVIVTRKLDPLLAQAAETGRLVAVRDRLTDRFDERWGELLGLGPLHRQAYVNSGFLIIPEALGRKLLIEWERTQRLVDPERSMIGSGKPADPFFFLDQDVLNALLGSMRFSPEDVVVLEHAAAPHPPFAGLRIADEESLRVVDNDGNEPFALHHIQRKPWLHPLAPSVYSELLPRLWLADDLPLRLEPSQVPRRFRPGWEGRVALATAAVQVATEQTRRTLRAVRSTEPPRENEAAELLWHRADELAAATVLIPDLLAHRLQCLEIRRRRRLRLPIPDELAKDELASIAASRTAPALLAEARAAYDGQMLLTKGYEVALRYPEPWLRPFSDLDLLVEDSKEAQAALLESGFIEVGEPSMFEGIHHLRPLWRPGSTLVIELHHAIKWPDGNLPPSTAELFEEGVPSRSGVAGVLTLPDGLHALTLAAHSWAHTPLRRLVDLVDIAALTGELDRQELNRLADGFGIGRIWRTTIAAVDEVLRGGRRPTLAGLTWARHLTRSRERTVIESHFERLLSPFWAHPGPHALAELGPRLLNEVQPGLDEGWPDKTARMKRATQNAFVRRSQHDLQLGPAANRRRRP